MAASRWAALLALCAPAAPDPVVVGNATQLLFDDAVIALMDGLTRTLNPPSFDRVVLQPGGDDAPWEQGFSLVELGTSIVRIPGTRRLRMYYTLRWGGMDAHGVPLSHSKALPDMYLQAVVSGVLHPKHSKNTLNTTIPKRLTHTLQKALLSNWNTLQTS